MKDLFKLLQDVPKSGVFIIKYCNSKECYIHYSKNIPSKLLGLSFKYCNQDSEFEILEVIKNFDNMKCRCEYYKRYHTSLGYKILNPNPKFNRKFKVELMRDFRYPSTHRVLIALKLVSVGYRDLTIGVFEHYRELEEFKTETYPNDVIDNIVYCNSSLMKDWLRNGF